MGTSFAVFLANFSLFSYEFGFLKHLLKNNTCPIVLHRVSLVHRFMDDLFVSDFPDFKSLIPRPRLFWRQHIPKNIL